MIIIDEQDEPMASAEEDVMYTILPVGGPVVLEGEPFDPDAVAFEELPHTSWVVDEGTSGPVRYFGPPESADPGDAPAEALPVPGNPGTGSETDIVTITADDAGTDLGTTSIEAAVARFYEVALGRAADADGLTFWTGIVTGGRTLEVVAEAFADVFVFAGEIGDQLDDAEFVAGLYRNGLGREADEAGTAYWLDRLADADTDRGDLLMAFADADEVSIL